MSKGTSPGSEVDPALVALNNHLLQREALRRASQSRASGSPSALEAMPAQISAHATSDAAEPQAKPPKQPARESGTVVLLLERYRLQSRCGAQ